MGITPVTVDYTVGGTATEGTDYVEPEGALVINPAGSLDSVSATITIQTRQDSEADESLVVTLSGVRTDTGRVTLGTPRVARTTLVSQETVIISVADVTVVEDQSASFMVSVSGEGTGTVKLRYETVPGTATADDFTAASDTRDINIGANPNNIGANPNNDPITVVITNDSRAEGEETFTLNLSLENPPDNVVLAATSAKATISDDTDDALSVSVDNEEESVEEGSDANFLVTLMNTSGGTGTADVVVKYMIAGSGTNPAAKEDYEVPGDSVTIPAGTNTTTITIPIVADDLLERNETLQVTLMIPTTAKGAFTVPPVTGDPATIDIIPQAQDAVTVSLAETAVTVTEGGKALFPVVLSGKVAQDLTFGYSVTAPSDGLATSDYTTAAEVEVKEGETRAVIEVNTTPDTVAENTETFTLRVALPTTNRPDNLVLGTPEATGTITDNDPINVTVEGPDRVVANGSANYRFRLTGDTTGSENITVAYTTNGTPANGDATITAGQTVSGNESVAAGASGSLVVRVTEVTTDAGRVASGVGRSKSTQIRPATTVLVSIADAANVDEEGGNASFSVTSSGANPNGIVTVSYQVSAGSASTSDFRTPSERTVTVGQSITVPIVDDDVAEGAETFRVTLSSPRSNDPAADPQVELGTTTATATINSSDPLMAEVSSQDRTVLEGESATFVVDLGGTSSASVEIDYTVAGSGDPAADADDFSPETGKLTIPAGRSTGTIQVEALDDDILEPAETLQVTLTGAAPANVVTVDQNNDMATTVIGANGSTVTVSLATTAVTVTEGGKASFPVVLSGKLASDLTVGYTLAARDDYTTADSAQVVIKEGDTRAVIEVNTTPDTVAENTETFTLMLTLSSPPAGVVLGTPEATGTITDNDPINVTVVGSDRVVAGDSGTYRFRLTGDTTASTAITVAYSTNSSPASGSTTIPADEAESATFTVSTDSLTSGSLVVRVTDVTTAAGRVASGVGRSKSTQIRPDTTVLVSIADAMDVDEEGGNASFSVTRSGASPMGTVTVSYQVSPVTASSSDFTTPSERTVTVGQSIMVPIVDDDVAEGAETFRVTLSSPRSTDSADRVELGITSGMATINRSDDLTAAVSSQDTTVLEGGSATFVVDLVRTGDLPGTSSSSIEIDYTVTGSGDPAADEDDFSPQTGKLTIPAGQSRGTIQVEALDDDILEPAETLQVTLTEAVPANVVSVPTGGDQSATTMIGASDSPARVSVADVTVDEGETAMIEVMLSKMVSSDVTVSYTLNPAAGDDYEHIPENLVFMPGDTAKTIEVDTEPDTLAEDEEPFTVTISLVGQVAGVSLGRSEATVTITDDALRATIEGPASVNEGDSAEYTVTVTGGTFGTGEDDQVTVTWSTEGGSATSADFSPTGGTLVLSAEDPSAMFTIQTEDDDIPELGEIIVVSLTAQSVVDGEPEPVRTGAPARTMIVDNDGAVEVSIMADQTVVAEGQQATFTVELTGAVASALTLRYATGDAVDTATAGTDYTAAGGDATVEIAAGAMSTTISVATARDGQEELADESFSVRLLDDGLPEDVAIDTRTARVSITDHEIRASVTAPSTPVNEGSAVLFTVSLTVDGNAAGAMNRTGVEVDYAIVGDVTAADYREASTGTVTFPAGDDEATLTITTRDDDGLDRGETLTLSLTNATSLGNQGLAVVHPTAGAASTTIDDGGSVTWSVADISVQEDEPAIFTVTLSALVQGDVTLTYSTRRAPPWPAAITLPCSTGP